MRRLSVRQKNYLAKVQDNSGNAIMSYDDLEEGAQDTVDEMNMYENLESDVDRFLYDRAMDKINRQGGE
jgi:hypothetical protein